MSKPLLAGVGIITIVGIAVFALSANKTPSKPVTSESAVEKDTSQAGITDAKLATNYYAFTKEEYDKLRVEGKPLLLYFYANWCPTCAIQEPAMITVMNNAASNGITALRVNYSDSDTDQAEKDLAKEFNITYQHTFVGLNANGDVVFTVNGQQTETDLKELFAKIR